MPKPKPVAPKPHLLTIKRQVVTEEEYEVVSNSRGHKLAEELMNDQLHLEQSLVREAIVRVRNRYGKVVAVLHKEGGLGPDEKVEITERNPSTKRI